MLHSVLFYAHKARQKHLRVLML